MLVFSAMASLATIGVVSIALLLREAFGKTRLSFTGLLLFVCFMVLVLYIQELHDIAKAMALEASPSYFQNTEENQ